MNECRPNVLFIISTTVGGTPATNNDLMRAMSPWFNPILLVSDSRRLTIYEFKQDRLLLASEQRLATPITPDTHTSTEYISILRKWLREFEIDLIHIRHLAWHSIYVPMLAQEMNIKCIMSLHDYYMICPTVKLLDEKKLFCGGKCSQGGECDQELWPSGSMPELKNKFVHEWQRRSRQVLSRCSAIIVSSNFAAKVFENIFPEISGRISIIPHGRDFAMKKPDLQRASLKDPKLRVIVANVNSIAKGSELLEHVVANSLPGRLEFHVLGDCAARIEKANVFSHGPYRRDLFVEIASSIQADLGFITSIWPETFCHVLTEMWASGLPVLAIDTGAVSERLQLNGGGWLLESADPELALRTLMHFSDNRREMYEAISDVGDIQKSILSKQTCNWMAIEYSRIYISALNSS